MIVNILIGWGIAAVVVSPFIIAIVVGGGRKTRENF